MIPAELRLTDQQWWQLHSGLLRDDNEHAALQVCGYLAADDDQVLLCRRVVPIGPEDLRHAGRRHLALAPTTLARVAKAARSEQGTMVVCHSHPFPEPVHASRSAWTPRPNCAVGPYGAGWRPGQWPR